MNNPDIDLVRGLYRDLSDADALVCLRCVTIVTPKDLADGWIAREISCRCPACGEGVLVWATIDHCFMIFEGSF